MSSVAKRTDARAQLPDPRREPSGLASITRILTCGSVDDGKSTLIGRLLWEIAELPEDQREHVREASRGRPYPDFSLLVDGLVDERAQGITIDVAWRYFDTRERRYVLIDSPGHETYTRNMASGASHADMALLLVDARKGVRQQTRRHAAILDLVGVRHVLVAVNKMDLVEWSERAFAGIAKDIHDTLATFAFESVEIIPLSALTGDNVVAKGETSPWYGGPTLVEAIARVETRLAAKRSGDTSGSTSFRFPVQLVLRDGTDFRGLAGTVRSGSVEVGDEVVDAVSGAVARVAAISQMGGDLDVATTGSAVVVRLDRDLNIARGSVLSKPADRPIVASAATLKLIWLQTAPPGDAGYVFRTSTDATPVGRLEIKRRLDFASLVEADASTCGVNDLVTADVDFVRPVALDTFAASAATGAVLLVDRLSGTVAAAGVILAARETSSRPDFELTEALLREGVCSDLGTDETSRDELRRRSREIERLFARAGLHVRNSIA
jgi:bifunctional enzyme CysN/CysC